MKAGYEATKRLLEEQPEVTAIMALSDTIAIGVMRAAADLGKHIPEELSVTGFAWNRAGRILCNQDLQQ